MLPWLTTAALASPWVEAPGEVRVGVAAWSVTSEAQFAGGEARGLTGPLCPAPVGPGERMPYSCVNGGTYRVRAAAVDAAVGVLPHLAVDATVPVVAASFADAIGRTSAVGPGDSTFGLRFGAATPRGWAWAAALHAQIPTGPGDFQDRDVPLGTGQVDLVPGVRVGVGGSAGWVEVWQAVAIRLRSPRTGLDPGDEWRPTAVAGWTPRPWGGLAGRMEGLVAARDRDGFGLTHPGRALLQLRPGAFVRPTAGLWVEAGAAIPLAGRRWPAAAVPYLSVIGRLADRVD